MKTLMLHAVSLEEFDLLGAQNASKQLGFLGNNENTDKKL